MDFIHVERAKAMLSGRWIYGYIDRHPYNTCYIGDVKVNNKTSGKYTGVRDDTPWEKLTETQQKEFVEMVNKYAWFQISIHIAKQYWNGIPIFEGDIIDGMWCTGVTHNYVVGKKFDMWGLYDKVDTKMANFLAFDQLPFSAFKVIGNIYDNPELMEG